MALLDQEVTRFADPLDDYEHVPVADVGGGGPDGYWLVVPDHRFGLDYEISSHCDYWEFIGAVVDHKQYIDRDTLCELCQRIGSQVQRMRGRVTAASRYMYTRAPSCKSVFVIHRSFRAAGGTANQGLIGHELAV